MLFAMACDWLRAIPSSTCCAKSSGEVMSALRSVNAVFATVGTSAGYTTHHGTGWLYFFWNMESLFSQSSVLPAQACSENKQTAAVNTAPLFPNIARPAGLQLSQRVCLHSSRFIS